MSQKKEDNSSAGRPITTWNDLSPLARKSLMGFAKMDTSQLLTPQQQPADCPDVDALENRKIGELTALCNERDGAVNSLRAALDASRRVNPFADAAPVYYQIGQRYQEFLSQIAALTAPAQNLQSQGRPRLAQMLEAQKGDVEGALKKVQEILGDNTATWNGMNQIALDTNKKLLTSQLQINEGWKKTFGGGS